MGPALEFRRLRPHLALLAVLAGCASPPQLALTQPVVLLGEVHDNAGQHQRRLEAFAALLTRGERPALLMEQFDRDHQGAIDRLLAQQPRPDADALIAAGAPSPAGWNWDFYRPFIALALQHGLPIVAANVSRNDARAVMRQGLAASGFTAAVPPEVESGIAAEVLASHCGMIDDGTAHRMALAQVARDQFMARAVELHAARGVLLLAGNGHVRNDIGVPRWLDASTRARSHTVGLLEEGGAGGAAFDEVVVTPAQPREDPCSAMRRPVPAPAG
jgi:uncharacterized iron-regulated protein